ncbi:MAG: DegT/DnrJ/EryC1/StrS family aminotransferase [Verrucomicrobiaceae bacterium]|nr:DegT/DnrJ/EryC1/StrS family aminotransferase [Verrucomicrobiaceae bacterium]
MPEPARVIPFARPVIGDAEKNVALEVLNGHVLVHGPRIHDFEHAFADWTNAPGAVALSSCTAGLHLAYFGRGLGAGDEVIVPAMTHVATAHAVELVGATPVFVDAEAATGNIDIDQIEAAITPRTKALSVVHYLGMPVDMDRINAIAQKHGLFVVEDCALAIGSFFKGVHAGLHGDIGLFSFYPVKHMTTLEGGMAISKHADVLTRMTRERAFGVDRTHRERAIAGQYDVTCLGFNYRMNELQAAVGIEQVKRLDSFLTARKANYDTIAAGLRDVPGIALLQSTHGDFVSSYYCQSIVLEGALAAKRFEFVEALNKAGIGTSIYYPRPVPEFGYYRQKYGCSDGRFPGAARIAHQSIALPVGPHLQPGDAEYIAAAVRETASQLTPS